MSYSLDGIDPTYYVADLTDALGSQSQVICLSIGFTLYKVKMGRNYVLVKVYNSLSDDTYSSTNVDKILREYTIELGIWKQNCCTHHFASLIGRSDHDNTIFPCPVYKETVVAKEHLRDLKHVDLLGFFLFIAEGLEHLHSNDIAHGDVRGDNILVGDDGRPRIADSGLSRIIIILDKMGLNDTNIGGAVRWMPFEFLEPDDDSVHEPSKPGDVWSFGMTMFELWSGKQPYHMTKTERIPKKIIEGQTPPFPVHNDRPDFEKLRKTIVILCDLCWKRNPAERVTMPELVHILRELGEGKDIDAIREEFEVEAITGLKHQSFSSNFGGDASRFSSGSSPSPSGIPSFSDAKKFRNVVDEFATPDFKLSSPPTSDSARSDRTAKDNKIPKLEDEGMSTVSGWSYLKDERSGTSNHHSARTANPLPPAGNTPLSPPNGTNESQNSAGAQSFNAFPPPPSPDSPWSSIVSHKTALFNYMNGQMRSTPFSLKTDSSGEPHLARWTSVCKINGKAYGRCTDRNKKKAEDETARQVLERLYAEDPSAIAASPSYLSKFRSYLAEHDLTDRFVWTYTSEGEDHIKMWTCEIIRDGVLLSTGLASKKQEAAEKAARNAVAVWTRKI